MATPDGIHGQDAAGAFKDKWSLVDGLDDNWETQY
jgi:hypothetical protein